MLVVLCKDLSSGTAVARCYAVCFEDSRWKLSGSINFMPSYVITGASHGTGFEFVRQLGENPENQVFRDRNVHVMHAEVVDIKTLTAAAAEVAQLTGGTLDCLINNVAFVEPNRRGLTLDGYPEDNQHLLENDIYKAINVNVIGVVHTINVFLPLLRKGTMKKIITISTGLGDPEFIVASGFALDVPNAISRAAVNMVVAKYAAEYKNEGLIFLALSPGFVDTLPKSPTVQELEPFVEIATFFKKAFPQWNGIAVRPEDSVKLLLGIIEKATVQDSGAFLSHHGNKEWL
ncbi:hypothetical protein A0H81_05208 [Grifola frondosa]|uniref:Uncharacterized protein n=1 Tax=Grifola frondosa TaxID=5627 RepID=A0A1C7MD45_GRIFR|nr:hypothetical protein A0H81_05208 [Grifola frondosa]